MRWQLLLKDISPELFYIKGCKNIVADALSRLDKIDNLKTDEYSKVEPTLESLSENFALNNKGISRPTSFITIMRFQQQDTSLVEFSTEKPDDYSIELIHVAGKKYSLICRHRIIVIPKKIQKSLVEWYHNVLCHSSKPRTELNIVS